MPKTILDFQVIPSARVLEKRSYRLAAAKPFRDRDASKVGALTPADYRVLDAVLSTASETGAVQFEEVLANRRADALATNERRGVGRATLARHLAALTDAGLLEVIPAQARMIVVEDE